MTPDPPRPSKSNPVRDAWVSKQRGLTPEGAAGRRARQVSRSCLARVYTSLSFLPEIVA